MSFRVAWLVPNALGKIYVIDSRMSQQMNKEPTHLEVAEDAVFLGSVQPAGRRSCELCAATHQEIASHRVTGAPFAFILGYCVTEQPLNTTDTAARRQSKGSRRLKEATS